MEYSGEGESNKGEDLTVQGLYREFKEKILPELERTRDETKRYLKLIAWLNTKLEEKAKGRIIITGGFAVEVYTARTHRTMDVDVIIEDSQRK